MKFQMKIYFHKLKIHLYNYHTIYFFIIILILNLVISIYLSKDLTTRLNMQNNYHIDLTPESKQYIQSQVMDFISDDHNVNFIKINSESSLSATTFIFFELIDEEYFTNSEKSYMWSYLKSEDVQVMINNIVYT